MGDKVEARRAMTEAGLPVLPGSPDPLESEEEALRLAREIGFPVIIKAAAGGGRGRSDICATRLKPPAR